MWIAAQGPHVEGKKTAGANAPPAFFFRPNFWRPATKLALVGIGREGDTVREENQNLVVCQLAGSPLAPPRLSTGLATYREGARDCGVSLSEMVVVEMVRAGANDGRGFLAPRAAGGGLQECRGRTRRPEESKRRRIGRTGGMGGAQTALSSGAPVARTTRDGGSPRSALPMSMVSHRRSNQSR